MKKIEIGLEYEKEFIITKKDTAITLKSGTLDVLATPILIAFMENVAFESLEQFLENDEASVGIMVEINHLAPTNIEAKIIVQSKIESVIKNVVIFKINAFEGKKKIGEATHKRAVVDKRRFLEGMNK